MPCPYCAKQRFSLQRANALQQAVCAKRLGAPEVISASSNAGSSRLAQDGHIRADGDSYVADLPLADPDLAARWAEAEAILHDNVPLLDYIRRCGALLHDVITGRVSPIETLFPDGTSDLAEGVYERSATLRYINSLAASAVEGVTSGLYADRPLRMLEIGAGTGSSTASIFLPLLPADRIEYWYTDVTPAFFDRARERFSGFPFLRFRSLNFNKTLKNRDILRRTSTSSSQAIPFTTLKYSCVACESSRPTRSRWSSYSC